MREKSETSSNKDGFCTCLRFKDPRERKVQSANHEAVGHDDDNSVTLSEKNLEQLLNVACPGHLIG